MNIKAKIKNKNVKLWNLPTADAVLTEAAAFEDYFDDITEMTGIGKGVQ